MKTFEEMMEEYDEKVNGITKEVKNMFKEFERIENEEKCPKCKKKTLINCNPFDYYFICSNCGNEAYIKK